MKIEANRKAAKRACEGSLHDANLVTEYSYVKHQFVQDIVKNEGETVKYYIGLQKNGSRWYWDQPGNAKPLPLDPNYDLWMPGFPRDSQTAVVVDESGRWMTVSPDSSNDAICERIACDTDHFCDSDH